MITSINIIEEYKQTKAGHDDGVMEEAAFNLADAAIQLLDIIQHNSKNDAILYLSKEFGLEKTRFDTTIER